MGLQHRAGTYRINKNMNENQIFFRKFHAQLLNLIPDFRRVLRRYQKIPAESVLQFLKMLSQLIFQLLGFLLRFLVRSDFLSHF